MLRFSILTLAFTAFAAQPAAIAPHTMPRIGSVSERFQSYNVEMVEVTGGRFWAPYNKTPDVAPAPQSSVPGLDPRAFRTREPINLSNPRLRKLAAALGPAYMRVSGTWANSTYFHDSDTPAPSTTPKGFGGVLARAQWKGVVDFAHAANAQIVTSMPISDGVRDAAGAWLPDQSVKLFAYTKAIGGTIAAAEFFNEPSFASMGGAPKGYNAAAYGRDFVAFLAFAKKTAPGMIVLGPGSVGEGTQLASGLGVLKSEDLLTASGHGIDAFSYHFYGGVSKRCAAMGAVGLTSVDAALSADWLGRTGQNEKFYAALRDRFEPGKPIWNTETGETACGGNPWASTFADSFRYLNQLGALAKDSVQVEAHNTLAASDYALIDEQTLTPRPNYWSALLWHKLLGTTVLDAGPSSAPNLHLYAHCLAGHPGGVALLAINAGQTASHEITIPAKAERYTLTAKELQSPTVELNGTTLKLGAHDALPAMKGTPSKAGTLALPPASITFLTFAGSGNSACH